MDRNITVPAATQNGYPETIYDAREYPGGGLMNFDVRKFVDMIKRNLRWIAAVVALSLLAGVIVTLLTPPKYIATSTVLVEEKADKIIEGGELQNDATEYNADLFLRTQEDMIKSRNIARLVVQSEKLADDANFFAAVGAEMPVADATSGKGDLARLRERLAVDMVQSTLRTELPLSSRVILIHVQTLDRFYSTRIANAYAANYVSANLNRKFESSTYARQFLAQQLAEARVKLEQSERDLNQYSRAAGLIRTTNSGDGKNTEDALSVTNESLTQLNTAYGTATADRIAAQNTWEAVAKEPVLSVPQVLANQAVQDLVRQRADAQGDLAKQRAGHLEDYPGVQAARARIADLDTRINAVGTSIKRGIYLDYQASQQRENTLKAQVEKLRGDALTEQDRGVQYSILKRVADTNRALYDALLERYNELNASAGAASNNVDTVDTAEVPDFPSSPNLFLNLALAFVIGLLAAVVVVFVKEQFDDAIRAPDDVETKLGLPLLGLVPLVDDGDVENNTSLKESYHTLVMNLLYSTGTGLPHSIAITSAAQGQGKTTTARAVATDLANVGKSVLLIDADLRRPTAHRFFDNPNREGLTQVLAGHATLPEVITPSPVPNLSYVTALPLPPEPSLLLGGPRLPAVLAEAKSLFDVVVVDCPPLLGLADAASIATHVDGVVMMIDASEFRRGAVKSAIRRLNLIGARMLGVVLAKFDPKTAGSEYQYYGYGYYEYGKDHG